MNGSDLRVTWSFQWRNEEWGGIEALINEGLRVEGTNGVGLEPTK